jgi:hypothetical protein
MSEPLDRITLELRAAVLAGDHTAAQGLVFEYSDAVRQVWEELPEDQRTQSTLPATALECLTWVRGMTVVQRAMAAEQLAVVEKIVRYQSDLGRPGPTVQVAL